MSFRKRTAKTYEALKEMGKQSLARLADLTGCSKSSVRRQQQAIESRSTLAGAAFFETELGLQWLTRLILAALFIFGLQANVGAERIELFFALINISCYVGLSAATINRLENRMRESCNVYEKQLMPVLEKSAKDKDLIAGADETFFERLLILVFMDLPSGFIFLEKQTYTRNWLTWRQHTQSIINRFKSIRCLVSDRAKALIKLSTTYTCENIADLFHLLMIPVKLLKFSFSRKLRTLAKQEQALKNKLAELRDKTESTEARKQLLAIHHQRTLLKQGQATYHQELQAISTAVHPFTLTSKKQTSAQIAEKLQRSLAALRSVVSRCEIQDKKHLLNKFARQIQSISSLTNLWWQWVDTDLFNRSDAVEIHTWAKEFLLPCVYWEQQIRKSKSKKILREFYKTLYLSAEEKLIAHSLTATLLTPSWMNWANTLCSKYQRTTSAIEGRNGLLSGFNHCARGMTELQLKTQTIIHNYYNKRADDTTATERLFGFKPPDLFEWLVVNMKELPLPRQRDKSKKDPWNVNKFIAAAA